MKSVLRRLPFLLVGLMLAVPVGWFAWRSGSNRIERHFETRANEFVTQSALSVATGVPARVDEGFYLPSPREPFRRLGQSDIDLPRAGVIEEAVQYPTRRRFTVDGTRFEMFGRPYGKGGAVFALLARDSADRSRHSLALRCLLGSFLGAAALATMLLAVTSFAARTAHRRAERQRAFLADAAHEMRTPLAVIQAASSQALAQPRTSEEYVRALAEIRAASERAATGVSELLELARLEAGEINPRLAPLRIDLLAEEVAAAHGPAVEALPTSAVIVPGDAVMLRHALDNLVRNAVRRAALVRVVTVVGARGKGARIEVSDDGPGIDPAVLPTLFHRFVRADGAGSAGLGLTIVAAIVAAHGGSVSAENPSEGGARFTVTLPG